MHVMSSCPEVEGHNNARRLRQRNIPNPWGKFFKKRARVLLWAKLQRLRVDLCRRGTSLTRRPHPPFRLSCSRSCSRAGCRKPRLYSLSTEWSPENRGHRHRPSHTLWWRAQQRKFPRQKQGSYDMDMGSEIKY